MQKEIGPPGLPECSPLGPPRRKRKTLFSGPFKVIQAHSPTVSPGQTLQPLSQGNAISWPGVLTVEKGVCLAN